MYSLLTDWKTDGQDENNDRRLHVANEQAIFLLPLGPYYICIYRPIILLKGPPLWDFPHQTLSHTKIHRLAHTNTRTRTHTHKQLGSIETHPQSHEYIHRRSSSLEQWGFSIRSFNNVSLTQLCYLCLTNIFAS